MRTKRQKKKKKKTLFNAKKKGKRIVYTMRIREVFIQDMEFQFDLKNDT